MLELDFSFRWMFRAGEFVSSERSLISLSGFTLMASFFENFFFTIFDFFLLNRVVVVMAGGRNKVER